MKFLCWSLAACETSAVLGVFVSMLTCCGGWFWASVLFAPCVVYFAGCSRVGMRAPPR